MNRHLLWVTVAGSLACHSVVEQRVDRVQDEVSIDTVEAEAALALLDAQAQGRTPAPEAWARLQASDGYRTLARRERAMRGVFDDAEFEQFLRDPAQVGRVAALRAALNAWTQAGLQRPLALAHAYLPPNTPVKATIFLVIKPRTNSFVFEGRYIFLFLDPTRTAAQFENTVAHELHHIGLNAACARPGREESLAREFTGALGEGLAMLAAAGGPAIHPHAVSEAADRARWDHDLLQKEEDLRAVDRFLWSLVDGTITTEAEAMKVAEPFWGEQGAWYTVGWSVASLVEQRLGHERLVADVCEPASLFDDYNRVAAPDGARFSKRLIDYLRAR